MFKRILGLLLLSALLLLGLRSALTQEKPIPQPLRHVHTHETCVEQADENSISTADKIPLKSPNERATKDTNDDLLSAEVRAGDAMVAREKHQRKRAYQLAYKQARRSWQRTVQSARLAGDTERLKVLTENPPNKAAFKNNF